MKKLKVSFATLVLVAASFFTLTATAAERLANDCSSVQGGPLDRDSTKCVGTVHQCCFKGLQIITGDYRP